MELEVVGRHALLFDDDSNANFVNSKEALVEWNSLFIDRYDVRHLLTSPPASFKRLRQSSGSVTLPDSHLESELDVERYADLPATTSSDQEPPEAEADAGTINAGGFHAVAFSYGNTADSSEQKDDDRNSEDVFRPPFPIPENLVYSLPSSEKVHQIIARTALFVSQHGGQSEIVLRVKQGDNPTFGFLMPHHHLHPYFRYLVNHPEILNASSDDKSQKKTNANSQSSSPATGGALSLLGSVYGSVEDEDLVPEEVKKSRLSNGTHSVETTNTGDLTDQHRSKKQDALDNVSQKDERSSKLLRSSKEKASASSKSGFGSTVKSKSANNGNKEDVLGSSSADVNKKISAKSLTSNCESLVIEPPSKLKKLVDRIVEIILKNGQGFEALLIEQDKNHGRFPFLLSSNQYHLYYKRMLRMALEARAVAKSFGSEKDAEKETGQSKLGEESAIQDLPFDYDKKEKFKMIIGKTKREIQESPSKELQQPPVAISADAVAAILQAATRGIKKPNLDIFNLSTKGDVGGQASSHGSQHSSQPQSSLEKRTGIIHQGGTVSVAKEIAKTAAMAAAAEADSSEAGLTKEQKLKAERLKRAKMFAAMIKSGVGKDPPRGLSAEPPRYSSGVEVGLPQSVGPPRGLSAEPRVGTEGVKYREGSSASVDAVTFHKLEKSEKHYDNELDESAATKKRHYRSQRHEDEDEEGESDEENDRHSRKKHRSHYNSRHHRDRSKDRHKHRRRHSVSKDRESRHSRHKHDSEDEDEHRHHHRHKHDNSSEDEYESSKHKRRNSDKDAHGEDDRRKKHKKRSNMEEGDLEEGEIRAKSSDQSPSIVLDAVKEKSVDRLMNIQEERASSEQPQQTTVVSDDLRAKIRAMLLATL